MFLSLLSLGTYVLWLVQTARGGRSSARRLNKFPVLTSLLINLPTLLA